MNIIFFNSHTFLTRELINSLKKRTNHYVVIISVPQYPSDTQINMIFEQIGRFLPGLIVTINDAGCDYSGKLLEILSAKGCFFANWYTDYPFYEEIFHGRVMKPRSDRIDFVSEASFVSEMSMRGFNSCFLPLATDPEFFNENSAVEFTRDVAFVGNSSAEFIASVIDEKREGELEKLISLQSELKKQYFSDPTFNIHEFLLHNRSLWEGKTLLPENELMFLMEWFIGYLYRRDFIGNLARRYGMRFTCFGDPYWRNFIDPSQVSTDACYYTNLSDYYRSTRVNINVNRIQIRTAFTQRIFDCAASGAFILTDKRECNSRFFRTSGAEPELIEFNSPSHCFELIDYFLDHEEERIAIAARIQENVLRNHTYDNRVEEIIDICCRKWML